MSRHQERTSRGRDGGATSREPDETTVEVVPIRVEWAWKRKMVVKISLWGIVLRGCPPWEEADGVVGCFQFYLVL